MRPVIGNSWPACSAVSTCMICSITHAENAPTRMIPIHKRMDWNHLKAFLETAQAGSLSAAARHLGTTQPTLSRRVSATEQQLGVTLFERVQENDAIDGGGIGASRSRSRDGAAADELALAATGQSPVSQGIVSVSATDACAIYLPPIVARIQAETRAS